MPERSAGTAIPRSRACSSAPSASWLEVVKTGRAKHHIRRWIKTTQFHESAKLGRGKITRVPKHKQTEIYVDRSIDFITRHKRDPFYLHLWLNDVHDAHVPSDEQLKKFAKFKATSRAHIAARLHDR